MDFDLSRLDCPVPFPDVSDDPSSVLTIERTIPVDKLFDVVRDVDDRFNGIKGFNLVGSQILNALNLGVEYEKYVEHKKLEETEKKNSEVIV